MNKLAVVVAWGCEAVSDIIAGRVTPDEIAVEEIEVVYEALTPHLFSFN